jgi:hypothetical protein
VTLILAYTDQKSGVSLMCADAIGIRARQVADKIGTAFGQHDRSFAVGLFGSDIMSAAMHVYSRWEASTHWTPPANSDDLAHRLFTIAHVAQPDHRTRCLTAIANDPNGGARLQADYQGARVTETFVRDAPGFISSALHRSVDGTRVTMYAQWRTIEDYEAMRRDPAPLPFFQEALTFATFEPGMYEVVETFTAPKT